LAPRVGSVRGERQMNQGARDANEEIARHAAASRQNRQIKLLEEIRNLFNGECAAEIARLHETLDRYRYAVCFAAGEAWDGRIEMRARFGWARALDGKVMTDDDLARIGQSYLDWEGGKK
jgi:hypothetical protein